MLAKLLLILSPLLSLAFAECLCHSDALSSAIDSSLGQEVPIEFKARGPRTRPQHPGQPREVNGTIYEFLAGDPKFSLVTKALKYEETIAALLDDPSARLTFFAPPDDVLKHHHSQGLDWSTLDELLSDDGITAMHVMNFGGGDLKRALDLLDDDDDDVDHDDSIRGDPERRKRIIKFILHAILSYHLVGEEALDVKKLGLNNTFPSHLKFPHLLDGQPLRLRVQQLFPPITLVNFISKILEGDISTTNGFVHVIGHPLIPPPPVFQTLYLVPEHFSTLTTAIQRSGLTDLLDLRFSHEKRRLEGAQAVTVFAPTNRAFQRLPRRLKLFLFSPFGARVLKKLLQYHVVPDLTLYSDYTHEKKYSEDEFECVEVKNEEEEALREAVREGSQTLFSWIPDRFVPKRRMGGPIVEPISHVEYTLGTAFENRTLDVTVDRKRISIPLPHHRPSMIDTRIRVNGQLVPVRDVVGFNGAIHVVDRLLDPRKHGHDHDGDEEEESWEDWEEWLPKWGE